LKQAASEVIVVDYDCPDNTAEFLAGHFPTVRTVKVADAGEFNLCRARNLGARSACGELLAFVDADIMLADNFATVVAQQIQSSHFGQFKGKIHGSPSASGTCVIPRLAFTRISGYDDVIVDYGGDDRDLYYRLELSGLKPNTLEPSLIDGILFHGNGERTRFKAVKDARLGRFITTCYRQVKNMILRLEGKLELDIEVRRNVYQYVKAEVLRHHDSGKDFSIFINLPHDGNLAEFPRFDISRMIAVKVKRKAPAAR
jgi:glycosyltransferase involved in cell wall biosynthesis